MRELIIQHIAPQADNNARISVGYRSSERAQMQTREGDFVFEFTEDDRSLLRWYLENYLQCPWGAFKDRAAQAEALMQQKGAELFEAVFPGGSETRELYDNVRNELSNTRIVIHAADPAGVSLPWELMRDPRRENCNIARLCATFGRSQPNLDYDAPAFAGDTFNILLVISRPAGEDDVPFQSVARRLLSAVREHRDRIHIDVLRPPTFEKLSQVLRDRPGFYHALHFDGHGKFDGGAMQGLLLFEGQNAPQRLVTGAELGALMTQHRLPLVVLNACQSGQTAPDAAYASVGNQLLQAGVGAVVAMAYSVYVKSAAEFIARFYERLAQGEEVARAVHAGREELAANNLRFSPIGELALHDWIVPVLFEAAPVQLVPPRAGTLRLNLRAADGEDASNLEIGFPERGTFGFIGRDDVVQKLERAFLHENIVLLRGMAGIGKTSLATAFAQWLAETGGLDGPGDLQGAAFFNSFEHYAPLERVVSAVGRAFNAFVRRELKQDWDQITDVEFRRDVVLQILRQTPCLLIWDNFEPVHGFPEGTASDWTADEQQALRDFLRDLRGGKTKVLLTSRRAEEWLNAPQAIYRDVALSGLSLSEAQELAVLVLERAGVNHHALKQVPDYNALLKFLHENPLAIQAILPELKHRDPAQLLADLQSGKAKLPRNDTQGRDRSLWASLNYRFDKLDPALRERLGVLGLFQGFVNTRILSLISETEGAPTSIAGQSNSQWQHILNAAAELGLLGVMGDGLYKMHPALPWFFEDLLEKVFPCLRDWLERAFSGSYTRLSYLLAQQFALEISTTTLIVDAEEHNLKSALRLSSQRKNWDEVAVISISIEHLFRVQGRWIELKRLLIEIENSIGKDSGLMDSNPLLITLWGYRATIAYYQRDLDKAMELNLRLKYYYEQVGDKKNLAIAMHKIGNVAYSKRDFTASANWYERSMRIREELNDLYGIGMSLQHLGNITMEQRKLKEAEDLYFNGSDKLRGKRAVLVG